jgi:transposase
MLSATMSEVRSCCDRSGHASQLEARFANMPPCLVGTEACVGAHHLSRKLKALGHDARLMPAKYVRNQSAGFYELRACKSSWRRSRACIGTNAWA